MAKHNCAICGAEVGLMSGHKLADGNFICRKVCGAKALKIFDKIPATLSDVTAHLDEVWDFVQKHQLLAIHDAYNINIPHDGKAIRIVHHGGHYYGDDIEPLGDGRYQPVGLPMEQLPDDLSLDIVAENRP